VTVLQLLLNKQLGYYRKMRSSKFMKKIKIIIVLSLLAVSLGGCSMETFKTQSGGEKYALAQMEKRYGKEFVFVGESYYKEEIIGLNWVSGDVAPKDAPGEVAEIYATNAGEFGDTYHIYYFQQEIEALLEPFFREKDYIQKYEIIIEGKQTTKKWTGEESLKEYLEAEEYVADLTIYLETGKTDDEYADYIYNWLKDLYSEDYNIMARVGEGTIGDCIMIFEQDLHQHDLTIEYFTHDRLVDNIEHGRMAAEAVKEALESE